jgi:hypothetical protein
LSYFLSVIGFLQNDAQWSGLCEEGDLIAQMFGLAQMFNRTPNVEFSTEPAFWQSPCACCAFSATGYFSS